MTTRLSNKAFAKLSAEHAANCQNCNWQGHSDDLEPISDVWERTDEGDTMWAGDCPECGAMAFTVAEVARQQKMPKAARAILLALKTSLETAEIDADDSDLALSALATIRLLLRTGIAVAMAAGIEA